MSVNKPQLSFCRSINVMIVTPGILQILSCAYLYKYFLLDNPCKHASIAGILLLLAAAASLRIKKDHVAEGVALPAAGTHS